MPLRFFADHCVSNAVASFLRDAGHDVLLLRDHMPTESPDPVVLRRAQEMACILLSLIGDFADIVAYPPSRYKGIVGLQIRNRPEALPAILTRLQGHLVRYPSMDDYAGKLILVEAHRIRIRQ